VLTVYQSLGGKESSDTSVSNRCCDINGVRCDLIKSGPNQGTNESPSVSRVTEIDWISRNLTGSLPSIFYNLTYLRLLSLNANAISGSISSEIAKLSVLEEIDITNNYVTGELPSQITRMSKLTKLSLTANFLNGTIPRAIGNLSSLVNLEMGINEFNGSIPESIRNLTSLKNLVLEHNNLSGNIPNAIGDLKSLEILSLSNNKFTGRLPPGIKNLKNLTILSLESNQLAGPLPTEVVALTNLQSLNLEDNQFQGTIPSEYGQLKSLLDLDLSHNGLSGTIPSELALLPNLTTLRVENNSFTSIDHALNSLKNTIIVVLPNPLLAVPAEILSRTPSFTLSESDWNLAFDSNEIKKRAQLSSGQNKVIPHVELCPLNDILNPEVPAGCIAGLFKEYCFDIATPTKLARCHTKYNEVLKASIFQSIGEVCPAWKSGPRSLKCRKAVKTFSYDLGYMMVTSKHASQFTRNVFESRRYAPCFNSNSNTACNWEADD